MLKSFNIDNKGSVSNMFIVSSLIILTAMGVALDFAGLEKQKSDMQNAADAAVLAVVTSDKKNDDEKKKFAKAFVKDNFDKDFKLQVKTSGSVVELNLVSEYNPVLLGAFGRKNLPVSVVSGSDAGSGGKLNIVLALDTTQSMEGSRLSSVKIAATDFVSDIQKADANQGNAKIGIVPFADYVRIDPSYAGRNWLDVPPDRVSSRTAIDEDASTNCREEFVDEVRVTLCDEYVYEERTNTIRWNGCMGSRPHGSHNTPYFRTSRFKGIAGSGSCTWRASIMSPLTTDFEELKTAIDGMSVEGKTYIPAGLIWGWRLLQEEALFTDEIPNTEDPVSKVLVLMTDGSNTTSLRGNIDGWDGMYHWGVVQNDTATDRQIADTLTLEMCDGLKAEGIRLVTVAFEVDDVNTKETLKTCASDDLDFYDAFNSEQLRIAFNRIGSGLSPVRLTR